MRTTRMTHIFIYYIYIIYIYIYLDEKTKTVVSFIFRYGIKSKGLEIIHPYSQLDQA